MAYDIADLFAQRESERYALHSRHLNEQMVRVLKAIGYDVGFRRGKGQYLYDREGTRTLLRHPKQGLKKSSCPLLLPEIYLLLLGNAILGGGSLGPEQSRLFRDLRQNAGLVYTIASRLAPRRQRYELSIEYACLPANATRIGSLIDAEIRTVAA